MRNLRLLVVDDAKLVEDVSSDVDIVPIGNQNRISSWEGHCEILASEKTCDFDLLTVDIVFDKDASDPSTAFLPPAAIEAVGGYNSAGLSHGMMALARRSPVDSLGNLFPLAWEIRSVSGRVLNHPELRTEAVRAYGLLRALLAQPKQDESLTDCLVREAREASVPRKVQAGLSLAETFFEDLVTLPPFKGSGWGILERTLPTWRRNFLLAVERREVSVDSGALKEAIAKLDILAAQGGDEEVARLALPISGWRGRAEYGISLASIFADLRRPTNSRVSELLELPHISLVATIRSWLLDVLDAAPPVLSKERLLSIAKFVHSTAGQEPERASVWWKDADPMERCFAYCVLLVRSTLLRRHADKDDKGLALDLGLQPTERTFLDPFKRAHFGDCSTAKEFRTEIRRSLRGEGRLLEVDWLREVLLAFSRGQLGLGDEVLRKVAPALLRS